jgi:hypothetical protein
MSLSSIFTSNSLPPQVTLIRKTCKEIDADSVQDEPTYAEKAVSDLSNEVKQKIEEDADQKEIDQLQWLLLVSWLELKNCERFKFQLTYSEVFPSSEPTSSPSPALSSLSTLYQKMLQFKSSLSKLGESPSEKDRDKLISLQEKFNKTYSQQQIHHKIRKDLVKDDLVDRADVLVDVVSKDLFRLRAEICVLFEGIESLQLLQRTQKEIRFRKDIQKSHKKDVLFDDGGWRSLIIVIGILFLLLAIIGLLMEWNWIMVSFWVLAGLFLIIMYIPKGEKSD